MASYEELVANERALCEVLESGREEELRAIPGVVHVSVGLKERGGRVTDELSIRVYVRAKRPYSSLSPSERVPPHVQGVSTDVVVLREGEFARDNGWYRPILGGIQITNGIVGDVVPPDVSRGTLGCLATLVADGAPMLLTCRHILAKFGAQLREDRVYQPAPVKVPHFDPADLPRRPPRSQDEYAIAVIEKWSTQINVDAAIARIDVSSWCRCCGIGMSDEIKGLGGIVGQRVATPQMKVFKVGERTGYTAGKVVTPNSNFSIDGQAFTGQIEVESVDGNRFSRKGDSGSVLIDEEGYIVGLVFAQTDDDPPAGRTYANHIAAVCQELGITINFTLTSTTAGARLVDGSAFTSPSSAAAGAYRQVRERLLRDASGAKLLALAELHRVEVVNLVTRRRPVTVAWHRAHGPAFFAAVLNSLRDGREAVPPTIEGISLHTALERMAGVLATHGSAGLRQAIATHGPTLLEAILDAATVHEVLKRLNATDFARGPELDRSRIRDEVLT